MELMTPEERIGLERGRKEGKLKEQLKIAKKLLEMNLSLDKVAEATELNMEEVEQINRELTI